jgi:hypothetical protein
MTLHREGGASLGTRCAPQTKTTTLLVAGLCVCLAYVLHHYNALAMRSRAVELQVSHPWPQDGVVAPLDVLLPPTLWRQDPPSMICLITPYESTDDIPELAGLDFGLDTWAFDGSDESSIGVVALDAEGGIRAVVRLSRLKVDVGATVAGRCYRPSEAKLVKVDTGADGRVRVAVQVGATVP